MKIGKYLSAALMISLVLTSAVGSFAATQTEPTSPSTSTPVAVSPTVSTGLSLDAAVSAAIKNNLGLQLSDLDKVKRKDDLQKAIDRLRYDTNTVNDNALYSATDAITNLKNSQESSAENDVYNKALIKDSVTNLYLSIRKAEVLLAAQDAQIALDNEQLKSDRIKANIGVISQYTLELNYSQYLKNQQTRDSMAIALEKTRLTLKNLIGADPQKPLTLDYSFITKYPFEVPNYESGLKRMLSDSLSLNTIKQNLKRSQTNLDTLNQRYPENKQDLASISTLKNAKDDLSKIKLDLDNQSSSASYTYNTAHTAVLDAMANYRQKQKDYTVAKTNFKNASLKYKLGNISKVGYLGVETQLKAADADQQASWTDYVTSRVALESLILGTKTQ